MATCKHETLNIYIRLKYLNQELKLIALRCQKIFKGSNYFEDAWVWLVISAINIFFSWQDPPKKYMHNVMCNMYWLQRTLQNKKCFFAYQARDIHSQYFFILDIYGARAILLLFCIHHVEVLTACLIYEWSRRILGYGTAEP